MVHLLNSSEIHFLIFPLPNTQCISEEKHNLNQVSGNVPLSHNTQYVDVPLYYWVWTQTGHTKYSSIQYFKCITKVVRTLNYLALAKNKRKELKKQHKKKIKEKLKIAFLTIKTYTVQSHVNKINYSICNVLTRPNELWPTIFCCRHFLLFSWTIK